MPLKIMLIQKFGIFRLTSPNGLHTMGQTLYDEREESFYATENYVNTKVNNIENKLSNYATTIDIENKLSNYATTEYVDSAIQNVSGGSIDESKFVQCNSKCFRRFN